MKYKLTAVLIFPDLSRLRQARDTLAAFWDYAEVINAGTPTEEASFYELERCRHDEVPPRPCTLIQRRTKSP